MIALTPSPETERLSRLKDLLILDSPPEAVFDSIARLASEVCGTPIALLSLVDEERQWFKANVGLPGVNETPRDVAFCAHAIGQEALFEVPDARLDSRFSGNPLVTGQPDIRFYAGMPLALPGGHRVGTLCVIDREPRTLNAMQSRMLADLGTLATQTLTLRRDLIVRALSIRSEDEKAISASESRYRELVEQQRELISLARPDGTLAYVNPAYARHFGSTAEALQGANLFDFVDANDHQGVRARFERVLQGRGGQYDINRNVRADGQVRWIAWTNTLQRDAQGQPVIHSVGRDVTEQRQAEIALQASENFLERTGRVGGVGGWQLDLASGELIWSAQTRRVHEVPDDYVPTLDSAIAFYAPEGRQRIEQAVQQGMTSGTGWDLELPLRTAKGRDIWVRAVGEVEFDGGQAHRLIGAFQDITERRLMQTQLAEAAQSLQRLANEQNAMLDNDIVGMVRLRNRTAVWKNRALELMFGYEPDELLGQSSRVLYPDDASHDAMGRIAIPEILKNGRFRTQLQMRHKAGHLIWIDTSGVLLSGETGETMWILVDITQMKQHQLQVEHIAFHDSLTHLPNRLLLTERMQQAIVLDQRLKQRMAVCFLDLDGFKAVNDQHGHEAGDLLLIQVAQRLLDCVRLTDTVARLGGDEFVVLLTPVDGPEACLLVLDRITHALGAPFTLRPSVTVQISVSIGAAQYPEDGAHPKLLMSLADAALYEAKRAGKNRVRFAGTTSRLNAA